MLIITKTKQQRRLEDRAAFNKELESKKHGIWNARAGRPGEREEYPDLGERYQALIDAQIQNDRERREEK